MDFVVDGLATGRALRIFTLVDNFTRDAWPWEVDSCLSSRRVTRVLDWVMEQRGARLRSGATTARSSRAVIS